MSQYKKLWWFIDQILEPNRSGCWRFYEKYRNRIHEAPGSENNHQAWIGGYVGHLEDVMNMATICYEALELELGRKHSFTLAEVYLIIFWHDVEKIFKYIEPKKYFLNEKAKHEFRQLQLDTFGIKLTEYQSNALKYIHGEGKDYTNKARTQNELAAFCHAFDNYSARGWYDYPR